MLDNYIFIDGREYLLLNKLTYTNKRIIIIKKNRGLGLNPSPSSRSWPREWVWRNKNQPIIGGISAKEALREKRKT